jgi:ectoine hydroxylase-related dioxygenase (phytanoyl-CoA dioxygenase family)
LHHPAAAPQPPTEHRPLAETLDRFHREGVALIPNALPPELAREIREASDAIFADPESRERHRHPVDFVIARLYNGPELFRGLLTREPIWSAVTDILGAGCEVVGLNTIRNPPSRAITRWHVDDILECPLPPEVPRFDARMTMPVSWLTVQVALTDIETLEHGPMQYVPGSQYSGRQPNDPENPTFEGRGAASVYCRAGDAYLLNHQCWHRGAPNTSDRTRYVLQLQYGARWAIRRFTGIA